MPHFGSNDETAVRWHLPHLLELGLLREGEVLCEVEGASNEAGLGVLVVTDLAVLFVHRPVFGSELAIVTMELDDVESVEAGERTTLGRADGTLVIKRRRTPGDPTLRDLNIGRLGRFAPLLAEDEVVVEAEGSASLGFREGMLVVTDRRLAFFMGGVLLPNRCVSSISLAGVAAVQVVPGDLGTAKLVVATDEEIGAKWRLEFDVLDQRRAEDLELAIEAQKRLHDARDLASTGIAPPELAPIPVRVEFDFIKGGRERAEEIAGTIIRQKRLLSASKGVESTEPEREAVPVDPLPRVSLGRGVASWVNRNGGRLYVWGDDFTDLFDQMDASIRPPDGVAFVRTEAVIEFELLVEDGMSWSRPIRLARRWFGLLPGITVSTGLVSG